MGRSIAAMSQSQLMSTRRSWHPCLNDVEETHDGCKWDRKIAGWTYDLDWLAAGTWWIGLDTETGEVFFDWENQRVTVPSSYPDVPRLAVCHQLAWLEIRLLERVQQMVRQEAALSSCPDPSQGAA